MAHPGAYRGTKRQKELKRLQKQQDKRERRLQKKLGEPAADTDLEAQPAADAEVQPTEPGREPGAQTAPPDAQANEGSEAGVPAAPEPPLSELP